MAHHLLVEQRAKQHMLDKACRTCEVSHPAPLLSQPFLPCKLRRGSETQKTAGDANESFDLEVGAGGSCNVAFVMEIAPSGRPDSEV